MLAGQVLGAGTSPFATAAICGTGGSVVALGNNQATAAPLANANNVIAASAAATGVRLPPADSGSEVWLYNTSGQTISIYPFETSGSTINGAASITVANAKAMVLKAIVQNQWAAILTA